MATTLYKYSGSVNRLTWFTTHNYALRNYYSDDIDFVPDPRVDSDKNCYVWLSSSGPCMATVDWGDGSKEQYPFVYHPSAKRYDLIFRSLNIEYLKDPNNSPWWFNKEDGSRYIPVAPHHYTDDRKDVERIVTVSFTAPVTRLIIEDCKMTGFPSLELPDLEEFSMRYAMYVPEIPIDRITRLSKLRVLDMYNVSSSKIDKLPDRIFDQPLEDLSLGGGFVLEDLDACGIRNISKLKNLKNLDLSQCVLRSYFKELNDLPNLVYLVMNAGPSTSYTLEQLNTHPDMSEVTEINQHMTGWKFCENWRSGERTVEWPDHVSGKGLENLQVGYFAFNKSLRVDVLPDFLYEMRSMDEFQFFRAVTTKARADQFVETFYNKVLGWDQITMSETAVDGKRNQFYGLHVRLYSPISPVDYRPSGTKQAPEGFVKGQSNGNPQTPMEMIYVLEENYNERWSVIDKDPT